VRPLTDPKPLALLNRSLVITTVLAALIMAAMFWLGAGYKSDNEWVVRSLMVRDQLTRTLNLVQSAETGQRGFLLTGRDSYLQSYDAAVDELPATLDQLRDLVGNGNKRSPAFARPSSTSLRSCARQWMSVEPGTPMRPLRYSTTTVVFG
jgi:hypothetical protein